MKKRAFTLFELLVSISIIGILIAVASMSYGSAQKKARDTRRIEDMNAIQKAAEMYYSQNNYSYPANKVVFVSSTLLQTWPKDPKLVTDYIYQKDVPAVGGYCVCVLLDSLTGGNSNANCSGFVASGAYYCVKNQQ